MPKSKTIFEHIINLIYPLEIPQFDDSQGFSFTKDMNGLAVDNIWVANSLVNQDIKETIIRIKDGGEFALTKYLTSHFASQIVAFGINAFERKGFEDVESRLLFAMFSSLFDPNTDAVITFVPPDPARLIKRGFHLPELIATELQIELNLKAAGKKNYDLQNLFIKTKKSQRQTGLDREQRLVNLAGKIDLVENKIFDINSNKQLSVFVIDDVCTTGATINECALKIKARFPQVKVYGLAVASNL